MHAKAVPDSQQATSNASGIGNVRVAVAPTGKLQCCEQITTSGICNANLTRLHFAMHTPIQKYLVLLARWTEQE